ncbi:MAG: carbohydrate-binding domain-containing protein, partial [Clostridia bacterium]|nr:carbohydrate-binding domain-containing protein [Clostridia bacterium]
MLKKLLALLLCLCCTLSLPVYAEEEEIEILLDEDSITVDGSPISEDTSEAVHLIYQTETHEDVPPELAELKNRVVTITDAGTYRFNGFASDIQIAVRAEETDKVRIILDGIEISCRTAPAIVGYSAHDPRVAGEYGLTIELAEGSDNLVVGSHTKKLHEDDVKLDGAIDSLVSLGFEGTGSLTVDADNEGVEVKFGHMTINGGVFHINSCDDPLNVSEDGVGVLTMNGGYVYSA